MTDAVSGTTETTTTAATETAQTVTTAAPSASSETQQATTPPVQLPVEQVSAEGAAEVEYAPTGDAALDVALSFVGKLGIAGDHPAMVAAGKGEFGLLKAHLATMGDKARGWEQMVALGEDAHKRKTEAAKVATEASTKAVHEIAGGEKQWNAVAEWAAKTATADEKAEINKLFDSGVLGARAAASLLVNLFRSANGTVVEPKSAVRPDASGAAVVTNGPLSPPEYAAAVRDLRAKLGNRMDASPEYAALRQRLTR